MKLLNILPFDQRFQRLINRLSSHNSIIHLSVCLFRILSSTNTTYLIVSILMVGVLMLVQEFFQSVFDLITIVLVFKSSSFFFGQCGDFLSCHLLKSVFWSSIVMFAFRVWTWLRNSIYDKSLHWVVICSFVIDLLHPILWNIISIGIESKSSQPRTIDAEELIIPSVPSLVMYGENGLLVNAFNYHCHFSQAPDEISIPNVNLLAYFNLFNFLFELPCL